MLEYYVGMAELKIHSNKYEEAIGYYDKAIEISSDDSNLFINRGYAKEELDDNTGAIADYNNAVNIDPDNSRALFLLGSLVIDSGDLTRGIEYLDKSIENDPSSENSEAYRYRGIAKNDSDMYREALNDFLQLISFNSLDGEAHLLAGYNHMKLGSFQLSLNCFKRAIAVFEENVGDEYELCDCYLYLGDAYLELNDVQSACVNWKKAMDLGNEESGELIKKHCS